MKNQKGMTLVEILVAMGLMVMVVFCFTPFMLSSLQNVQVAGDQRENLYTQKGDMEEQIAEGIDYSTPASESDNVGIVFKQNGITANGAAQGIYLSTADENGSIKLTSFLARDEATFNISPSSVSENCSNSLTIKITCDFITFEDESLFALKTKDGAEMTWVKFHIDGPNEATMSANASYQFDISKQYFIWYGEDLHKQLRVNPSSMIAVGDGGAYYVLTSEGSWKPGVGPGMSDGKLGGNTLNDVVWTGTQYVAAGEKGSWFYTEDGYGWNPLPTNDRMVLNHLRCDSNGKVYVSGSKESWTLFGGWRKYPYQHELEDVTALPEESGNLRGVGEASVIAWVNGKQQVMWGTYYETITDLFYTSNQAYVEQEAVFTQWNHIGDLESNGNAEQFDMQPEMVAVSKTSGQIFSKVGQSRWIDNGNRLSTEKVPNPDKAPAYIHSYWYYGENDEQTELKITFPNEEQYSRPLSIEVDETGRKYIVYNEQQYFLTESPCTVNYEKYYKQGEITISNVLNAVAYGVPVEDGEIWVAGGDVTYESENRFIKSIDSFTYSLNENSWEQIAYNEYPSEPDDEAGGDEGNIKTNAKILWRDAHNYQAGEWQVATINGSCGTINDIEFIGGKFYAVGDAGTILVSKDGMNWDKMPVKDNVQINFNGIAGWGDEG